MKKKAKHTSAGVGVIAPSRAPSFVEWLEPKYGKKWCVAPRLTSKLREKYTVAIPAEKFAELEKQYVLEHPRIEQFEAGIIRLCDECGFTLIRDFIAVETRSLRRKAG